MTARKPPRWTAKLDHPTWALLADKCPACEYPEAEGGWCANCGWTLPHPKIALRARSSAAS